jgi:hypothetical protein
MNEITPQISDWSSSDPRLNYIQDSYLGNKDNRQDVYPIQISGSTQAEFTAR